MGNSRILADLHAAAPIIGPSLLAADLAHLGREIRRLEEAGAKCLHLDVMDGHFVPNLSFGIPIVEAVRRATDLPLDVHLMISNPDRYVEAFRHAGADVMTIHIEADENPLALMRKIRCLGAGVGIAINPPTQVETLEKCLAECDLVLTMSVMPGFGGQEFDPVALEKLRWLRRHTSSNVLLSVDGGINPDTIGSCAEAGADLFVVGTALLGQHDYRHRMAELTAIAKSAFNVRV